jgi:hypothetical protein
MVSMWFMVSSLRGIYKMKFRIEIMTEEHANFKVSSEIGAKEQKN